MAIKPVRLITPSARDIEDRNGIFIAWVQDITKALTGGIEGGDVLTRTSKTQGDIVDGTKEVMINVAGKGTLDIILETQEANIAAATEAASDNGGGGGGGGTTLTATVNRSALIGQIVGTGGAQTVTTGLDVTVTPVGGTAPYTIAWTTKTGDVINANDPTGFTTKFNQTMAPGQTKSGTQRGRVTDDVGTEYDVTVSVHLAHNEEEDFFN